MKLWHWLKSVVSRSKISSAKLKNPSSFFIPCLIGNVSIERALCHLRSSVSALCYKELDLGEMRPITISLQFADYSVKCLMGILEDVPIKIEDLYVPVDFLILEMKEDTLTPIILVRLVLATAGVV